MNRFLPLLGAMMLMGSFAAAQGGDLGAQIAADDAALGASAGEIHVTASGTISEGKVSLSVGHDLVCDDQVTISLNAGSYIYQNSQTSIKNCIISATSTPIQGEIQSVDTDHLELNNVTFTGGGNLVYWSGVTSFQISDTTVLGITAADPATQATMAGIYLVSCSQGQVDNFKSSSLVFPAGSNSTGVFSMSLSSNITINNPAIHDVDASHVLGGAGAIAMSGSSNITINGGAITNNANMDGILSESYGNTPSSNITITGVTSSYNGAVGSKADAPAALGDGIDLINTRHALVSHCTLKGNGNLHNQQPGIWIFLDDDVVVEDSDISDGSMAGVAAAGTPNVRLLRNSINRNQASGVFTEFQAGTATNVGPAVTFVAGVSGSFGLPWAAGTPFVLDGVTYQIASVTDSSHLVLTTSPPDHSSPVAWEVNTTEEIRDSVINDNGLGRFGGQNSDGISWADRTTGTISGVTATDTGAGTQLYALELENTATAVLEGNNFSGNVRGGDGILATSQTVSPPSLSFVNQEVGTASTAQSVTLTAGAVAAQNLLIQATGNFSQTNNCGTALAGFGTCQILLSFAPTAAGPLSGALTITNTAPNSPQTVSLTGTAVSHGLGLSVATGGSNFATVTAGAVANYSLSLGGAGMSGAASLSCTGTPAGATCSVPATLAINATLATPFVVSVVTRGPTSAALSPSDFRPFHWLLALALVGWVILPAGMGAKQSARRLPLRLLLFLLMFLCSCGGSNSGGTPTGTYTLTVTANFGNTSEQMRLTLQVR